MTRVLYLCEYSSMNGGEQSLLATLLLLPQRGIRATVACPVQGTWPDRLRETEIETVPFELQAPSGRKIDVSEQLSQLELVVQKTRPDIIHANSLSMARLLGRFETECKRIGHLRDILKLSGKAIHDLNQLDRRICVSQATAQFHINQGLQSEGTCVIHNGIVPKPQPSESQVQMTRQRMAIKKDDLVILSVGQIGMRKGLDVLLQALKEHSLELPQRRLHAWIAGQRFSEKLEAVDYELQLHELAKSLGEQGIRVKFLGWRNDVSDLLRVANMVVHPARQEPLGRVLLEAGAHGVPVLTTDVGGTREIFPNEESGAILVPPDDPVALGSALVELITDPNRLDALGLAARRRITAAFSIERCVNAISELYEATR